jgi:hypothetical protein
VTVYVEDINDHAPQFINVPYHVTVDELTPTGKYQLQLSGIRHAECQYFFGKHSVAVFKVNVTGGTRGSVCAIQGARE